MYRHFWRGALASYRNYCDISGTNADREWFVAATRYDSKIVTEMGGMSP